MLEQPENLVLPQCENAQVRSISREVDLAWLAGILDGEGSLAADLTMREKRYYLDCKVRVYNTDVRMIQKVARIYVEMGIVFFYNLNKKRQAHYKDQLGICVTSQGSCIKVLDAVAPYLANKREHALAITDVIKFVKSLPRAGATWSNDYADKDAFKELMAKCQDAKVLHIDPSTTTRKAGNVVAW